MSILPELWPNYIVMAVRIGAVVVAVLLVAAYVWHLTNDVGANPSVEIELHLNRTRILIAALLSVVISMVLEGYIYG